MALAEDTSPPVAPSTFSIAVVSSASEMEPSAGGEA